MSRKKRDVRAKAPRDRQHSPPAAPSQPGSRRVIGVDSLRGIAILLMFAYHFCFDLRFYRVTQWDFEHDWFWLGFRALIVASFMILAGISLVLADRAGASSRHFWKRVGVIAACAVAASIGSYALFPQSFITFGILHCIAVTSVIAWPLVRRPRLAIAIGVLVVVAGLTLSHPAFDNRALSWLGFTTMKPATEDYVPLAPWAGVAFIGIALGHALIRAQFRPLTRLARAPRTIPWLGRHSLAIYMIHQPILLALLWVVVN